MGPLEAYEVIVDDLDAEKPGAHGAPDGRPQQHEQASPSEEAAPLDGHEEADHAGNGQERAADVASLARRQVLRADADMEGGRLAYGHGDDCIDEEREGRQDVQG